MRNKLIGELIGISRAVNGNEHLIQPSTISFIREALCCTDPDVDILERALEQKRKLVPNCFSCANPCGRTDSYDLSRLEKEEPEIRRLKYAILAALETRDISWDDAREKLYLRALFSLGLEGLPKDYYEDILTQFRA